MSIKRGLTKQQRADLERTRAGEFTGIILCYSRCLHCGIRTPHEVCHDCGRALDAQRGLGAIEAWSRFDHEPQACSDPKNDACRGPEQP